MRRVLPHRSVPRHRLMIHRPPRHRAHGSGLPPMRTSDLVMAILGVALLGGLALMAAFALASGAIAP